MSELYDRIGSRWPSVVGAALVFGYWIGLQAAQSGWFK